MSPRTRWIALVVGLLVGNVLAVVILIGAAGGDTHRRVLPDYYDRAVAWDGAMAEAETSARLGWRGAVRIRARELELSLVDRAGAPLVGAAVTVRGLPRGHADEPVAVTLTAAAPGVYRGSVPGERAGLHDVAIVAERGGERWVVDRVVELGRGAPP